MPIPAAAVSYARSAILALTACVLTGLAAAKSTVCTITINSADERETFRRHLPGDAYRIVELVQRGHRDWLDAACRSDVRCDALVISGHFDGGVEFYSDRFDQGESLPVDDLERAACGGGCPALFAQLKEVYLFGCNTLNAEATTGVASEVERVLRKLGQPAEEAARVGAMLNDTTARSNRDRMQLLFNDVPVLYGFSSKAPLGHVAAPVLERYLQTDGRHAVGSGRASADLVRRFAPVSMTTASGAGDAGAQAGYRRDICAFADPGPSLAPKARHVHEVLKREAPQVRVLLDPLERYVSTLPPALQRPPELVHALAGIARDAAARARFLGYARATDEPSTRARMVEVAHGLGWLTAEQLRAELEELVADRLAARPDPADIDLACRLHEAGRVSADRAARQAMPGARTTDAAMLACLGDAASRRTVLASLGRSADEDLAAAEVLLHHRPLSEVHEVRAVAAHAAQAPSVEAQARVLRMLSRQPIADEQTFASLSALFVATRSLAVQRAVAELLVRAEVRNVDAGTLASRLRAHRLPAPQRDVIDVLIRRLEAS